MFVSVCSCFYCRGFLDYGFAFARNDIENECSRADGAVSHRGQVFGVYRSEAIVFAPALVSTTLEMTVLSTVPQG